MSNRKLDRCDRCSTAIEVGHAVALTDMATMVELPHGDYSATFELSGENYMDVYCPECYETNRTLLEAAPELLAALEESVAELCLSINFNDAADLNAGEEPDGDPDTIAIVGRAEAAIAKAKATKEDDV